MSRASCPLPRLWPEALGQGDYSRASKVLEAAWRLSPHPEIAEAYINVRPGDTADDKVKRARVSSRSSSHGARKPFRSRQRRHDRARFPHGARGA